MTENSEAACYEAIIHLLSGPGSIFASRNSHLPPVDWVAPESVDWEQLWQIANRERVVPLLYRATRRMADLPDWWQERCRAEYQKTGILNTLRFRELSALLADLRLAGLKIIVLKGVALVELIYGNPALRPMVDLDLLIHKDDVRQAIDIFAGRGYRVHGHEIAIGSTLAYENEVALRKETLHGWQIELHWGLFDSPYYQSHLPEDEWWRTSIALTINGEPAFCLSPEWTLIHLCGHLTFHHHGEGLLWWHDLAALLQMYESEINWDYVITQVQAADVVLPLKEILPRLETEWGVSIAPEITARLQGTMPKPEEIEMNRVLAGRGLSPGQRMLIDVRGFRSWHERFRFFVHNLFPSAAYMDARYDIAHPVTRPFYYVYRWLLGFSGVFRDFLYHRIALGGKNAGGFRSSHPSRPREKSE